MPGLIKKQAVAAALLLFPAAGCGHGVPVDSTSSPLGNGGDSFTECVPDPSGHIMTNGWTVLENHSAGTVIVEQVSLYGDHHLQLVHALVVPIRYNAIGMAEGWPPPRMNITQRGIQWNERVTAIGARLPPGLTLQSRRNLVIGMRPTAHLGTATGVQVRYRENGHQYLLRTHTEYKVLIARTAYKLC